MMTKTLSRLAALVVLATSVAAQCQLTSVLNANNGLQGSAFDVLNLTGNVVRISSMDVNIDTGTHNVEIWACSGSAASVLTSQASWTQVATFAGVAGAGINVLTTLPAFCTPIDIPANGTIGIYYFTSNGSFVNYTTGTAAGATSVSDATLRFFEGWGVNGTFSGSPITGRIPGVSLHYVCPGPPGPPPAQDFQTNGSRASLTINGVGGNACGVAATTQTIYNCAPIIPVTGAVTFTSVNVGLPWDIVLSGVNAVGASSGGITVPGPQYVNINFAAPAIFLNGVLASNLPGAGLPGVTSSTLSFGYSFTAQTDFTLQGVVVDPTVPALFSLTQACEYHGNLTNPSASVAGPTTDTSSVAVSVVAPATCWAPGGIPFFGVNYTQMFVQSNGRVVFVATDTDASATVAESLTDNPFVGYWCDLNPALGGSITITNPAAGIVRVNYANVPYAGEAATANSFGIEFDTNTGIVKLDGLAGIVANPQTTLTVNDAAFLGISRGLTGATNGLGAQLFTNTGNGSATNVSDIWYDFYLQVAAGAGRPASLNGAGLNSITFIPSAGFSPNYDWIGG